MLERAAAAHSEVRATRLDTVRRSGDDIDQARLIHVLAPLDDPKAHPLARQRPLDEHSLALEPRDTASIVRKIDDVGFLHLGRIQVACHAVENFLSGAALDSRKSWRSGANSRACSAASKFPRTSSNRR